MFLYACVFEDICPDCVVVCHVLRQLSHRSSNEGMNCFIANMFIDAINSCGGTVMAGCCH